LIIYTVPTEESNNKAPYLKVDGVYTPMDYVENKPDIENIYNLTGAFMGSN
jgi:hypothetical protein